MLPLEALVDAIFGPFKPQIRWMNFKQLARGQDPVFLKFDGPKLYA